MTLYAALDAGRVVGRRNIPDWDAYPKHKRIARDEKGDGHLVLRPIVIEGDGPIETEVIEADRVRIVRSHPPLADVKAGLKIQVDQRAEERRLQHITPGDGMAMVYREKFEEAQGVRRMGEDAANQLDETQRKEQFPLLAASIPTEAATLWKIASLVADKAEAWADTSYGIEKTRIDGKAVIDAATTVEDAHSAYASISWGD